MAMQDMRFWVVDELARELAAFRFRGDAMQWAALRLAAHTVRNGGCWYVFDRVANRRYAVRLTFPAQA
jgi:hypothetical protein